MSTKRFVPEPTTVGSNYRPGVTTKRHPGRRKATGTLDFSSGHMMWVLGYCTECDGKVLVDRSVIEEVAKEVRKTKSQWQYKLLARLIAYYQRKTA